MEWRKVGYVEEGKGGGGGDREREGERGEKCSCIGRSA